MALGQFFWPWLEGPLEPGYTCSLAIAVAPTTAGRSAIRWSKRGGHKAVIETVTVKAVEHLQQHDIMKCIFNSNCDALLLFKPDRVSPGILNLGQPIRLAACDVKTFSAKVRV